VVQELVVGRQRWFLTRFGPWARDDLDGHRVVSYSPSDVSCARAMC
jgi:hypothetical protein